MAFYLRHTVTKLFGGVVRIQEGS